jgi:hypothetical protein
LAVRWIVQFVERPNATGYVYVKTIVAFFDIGVQHSSSAVLCFIKGKASEQQSEKQAEPIVNVIRVKWITMIHTVKHVTNREFQHCAELQLIEVMNMKMHAIQFVSIVN